MDPQKLNEGGVLHAIRVPSLIALPLCGCGVLLLLGSPFPSLSESPQHDFSVDWPWAYLGAMGGIAVTRCSCTTEGVGWHSVHAEPLDMFALGTDITTFP